MQPLLAVGGQLDRVAGLPEDPRKQSRERAFVFDEEQPGLVPGRGVHRMQDLRAVWR